MAVLFKGELNVGGGGGGGGGVGGGGSNSGGNGGSTPPTPPGESSPPRTPPGPNQESTQHARSVASSPFSRDYPVPFSHIHTQPAQVKYLDWQYLSNSDLASMMAIYRYGKNGLADFFRSR